MKEVVLTYVRDNPIPIKVIAVEVIPEIVLGVTKEVESEVMKDVEVVKRPRKAKAVVTLAPPGIATVLTGNAEAATIVPMRVVRTLTPPSTF